MRFTYEECTLINLLLEKPDKMLFLKKLESIKTNTTEKQICSSIDSLISKIEGMSIETIKQLYDDRIHYKINVFPIYEIK